jgi:cell division protein ZapA (FtsZ GTPase activity inhibitor)
MQIDYDKEVRLELEQWKSELKMYSEELKNQRDLLELRDLKCNARLNVLAKISQNPEFIEDISKWEQESKEIKNELEELNKNISLTTKKHDRLLRAINDYLSYY